MLHLLTESEMAWFIKTTCALHRHCGPQPHQGTLLLSAFRHGTGQTRGNTLPLLGQTRAVLGSPGLCRAPLGLGSPGAAPCSPVQHRAPLGCAGFPWGSAGLPWAVPGSPVQCWAPLGLRCAPLGSAGLRLGTKGLVLDSSESQCASRGGLHLEIQASFV